MFKQRPRTADVGLSEQCDCPGEQPPLVNKGTRQGTRRRRWRWLDGKHRLLSRTHSASRALAWVPRQVCFQRGLDGSFGDGFDVLYLANGREAAGRREVAESGLSAFGLLTGKADADLGTPLGSV